MNRLNYFKGLDSLRFIAALMVVIGHVSLVKGALYLPADTVFEKLDFGGAGVNFFFCLSGFLITYLLVKEKEKYNTIALKKFYFRRMLRIWPLYYLIVALGFFALPYIHYIDYPYFKKHFEAHYFADLILYLLILPQLAFSLFPAVPHIGQSWSIGVEELFYMFWPLVVRRSKNIVSIIKNFLLVYILWKGILLFIYLRNPGNETILYIKNFFVMCRFENMLIGAAGACFYFNDNKKNLSLAYKPAVLYAAVFMIPLLNYLLYDTFWQNGLYLITSVCYIIIILNVATNNALPFLENRALAYLGRISYGIYMYHLMIIPFIVKFFMVHFSYNGLSLSQDFFVYVLSIGITIGLSALSFRFFESPLLRLKKKFEVK